MKIPATQLSEVETQLYSSILEGGQMTLSAIADKTALNRTTLYPYIDSLLKKDYIRKTIKGRRTFYTAANPQKIFNNFKDQLAGFEEQLPFLVELYKKSRKQPVIQVFEGDEGIFKAFKEAYSEALYIKTFFEFENFSRSFPMQKEGNELLKLLKQNEIQFQGLASDSPVSREFVQKYKNDGINAHLMPKGMTFPAEFFLYNQKVLLVSYERKFVVVIESEDIKVFLETLFDYFWKIGVKV